MPGAGFKEFARKATVLSQKLRDDPITVVKAAMVCIFLFSGSRPMRLMN
jgi:hypothetical protein